jgi:hypothetical protein
MQYVLKWWLGLMQTESDIRHGSPQNILWRLFRIEAEKQMLPKQTPDSIREVFMEIEKNAEEKKNEGDR